MTRGTYTDMSWELPDELYNALLQHFVNEAVGLGVEVNKFTQFDNWVVECEVDVKEAVH